MELHFWLIPLKTFRFLQAPVSCQRTIQVIDQLLCCTDLNLRQITGDVIGMGCEDFPVGIERVGVSSLHKICICQSLPESGLQHLVLEAVCQVQVGSDCHIIVFAGLFELCKCQTSLPGKGPVAGLDDPPKQLAALRDFIVSPVGYGLPKLRLRPEVALGEVVEQFVEFEECLFVFSPPIVRLADQ